MKLVSNFAERLKLALELRNMKATKLSELTNVNKSTISQYLSGDYEAKKDRIELFAEVLNVNELWLRGYELPMENEDDKERDILIKEYQLSADEIKEYENIAMTTSTLMFNGKPVSEEDKNELEKVLKEFFIRALLKKRADENNDRKKKKEILKLIDNLYFEFGTKNPISICKGLGIEILSANVEMKGLYTVVLNSKLIVIQSLLEGFAKLFVIGHELFHALEHDCDEIRFFREHTSFKTSIYEEEANFFSVQLLKDYIEYHQDEIADLEIAEEIEKFI